MRIRFALLILALLTATSALAGISSIVAHGHSYSPGDEIPIFVSNAAKNVIKVKGQYMDLCTHVVSSVSSIDPSIGNRVHGSNSSVEILIDAGSASDDRGATIRIKFASGEETFRVRTRKIKIDQFSLEGKTTPVCTAGERVTLKVSGNGLMNLRPSPAQAMLEVAAGAEESGTFNLISNPVQQTDSAVRYTIECRNPGSFRVTKQWFEDKRIPRSHNQVGEKMVRGTPSDLRVTIQSR